MRFKITLNEVVADSRSKLNTISLNVACSNICPVPAFPRWMPFEGRTHAPLYRLIVCPGRFSAAPQIWFSCGQLEIVIFLLLGEGTCISRANTAGSSHAAM